MKVMIIAPIDPFASIASGVKTYTLNLISYLAKKNINSILLGITNSEIIKETSLNFEFIPVANKKISGYIYLIYLFRASIFLKISTDTVIHAQRPDYLLPFILLYRRNPKVCTLHGAHVKNVSLKKGLIVSYLYGQIEQFVFHHIDKVIMISTETRDYYCIKYPFLKEKSLIVPNGVNIEVFGPVINNCIRKEYGISNKEKVMLYVGRLEKEKRVDCIIKVYEELKEVLTDLKLIIVGNGREKKSLQTSVKDKNLTDITFIENLSYEKIPEIMNCADLLIMCSLHEGMPTVVLEALACGLPVVSTDVGDLNSIITDETGYIFKDTEMKKVKDIILNILLNNKISKNSCVEIARNYSWENVCKKIVEVYYEVIEKDNNYRA